VKIEDYKKVNDAFQKKLIFNLGSEAGFFSEFNNMILSMIFCLNNEIQFVLYSKNANFGFKNGWDDYFKPFCYETKGFLNKYLNRRRNYFISVESKLINKIFNNAAYIYKKLHGIDYLTFDLFDKIRQNNNKIIELKPFGISGNLQELCKIIIEMIWQFNDSTNSEIKSLMRNIELPEDYISIHIRGGDKFIDTPLINFDEYMKIVSEKSKIRNVFILTDDYRYFENLTMNYPNWNFFTLTYQDERGYFHKKFMGKSKEDRKRYILKLLASIEIISNSKLFIGTFSSNIGMYMGMRMPSDKIISIDLPEWQIW